MPRMPRSEAEVAAWFAKRLPDDWFSEPPTVRIDKDEILVIGSLVSADDETETRIVEFREQTRQQRMEIADDAQLLWKRTVSWGARTGDIEARFTTAATPVMTRLRFDERQVLDTLIDAGVARSRSEALAWCVQQVGKNQEEWIGRLKEAMTEVERIRKEGPV